MGLETDSETPLSPPDRRPPKKASNDSYTAQEFLVPFYFILFVLYLRVRNLVHWTRIHNAVLLQAAPVGWIFRITGAASVEIQIFMGYTTSGILTNVKSSIQIHQWPVLRLSL